MSISFYKYQGTGNDFIMIDNRESVFPHDVQLIARLCNRRTGIGADGLILIENHPSLDFDMVYFNADGSQSLCGNGSRCAVNFAKFLGVIQDTTEFNTIDGQYAAEVKDGIVHLSMKDQVLPEQFEDHYFLNNGSPHHIIFVEKAETAPVVKQGATIRYSQAYQPNGTNVNFVEIINQHEVFVRTYERGVEDETLSCGTGITASCLASADKGLMSPIDVQSKGGRLQVQFERNNGGFTNIKLIGPAEQVFEGSIDI
ncbi:diaminopimelate epimerase [Gilvimarinus agarilyticus]|uniref:diaminopimelate epimerase n=1 Tax=Reichenbachiella TaxID=156993 RepID=UPI000E6CB497|nr:MULTISPECIES: diaminopimelate epimerase [Reichenbachiella]MBU2884874.1 diaminopimelate epimerase [Gilvimarinus agarilyticus]MBU2914973.1 diaminopimelate epimerase [Reichenbachiella agariperforans]RJE70404.1 diaminopimelate epimerase [Reichenbachiella sp. MSK19-1]